MIKVTKREILFSTLIVAIMVGLGIWLSNPILSSVREKELEIASSVQVDSPEKFDYIRRTDAGNFLAEGVLEAVDPVSIPDIAGEYMFINKIKERYTMHTRTVTTTDSKGHTHTRVETYWTWDQVSTDRFAAKTYELLQKRFHADEVKFKPNMEYHSTVKASVDIRYVYYTYPTRVDGVMYGHCNDKGYHNLRFKAGSTIATALDEAENRTKFFTFLYWFIWFIVTGLIVFAFYAAENYWLEDEGDNKRHDKYYRNYAVYKNRRR